MNARNTKKLSDLLIYQEFSNIRVTKLQNLKSDFIN
jgi:hypothetical protein